MISERKVLLNLTAIPRFVVRQQLHNLSWQSTIDLDGVHTSYTMIYAQPLCYPRLSRLTHSDEALERRRRTFHCRNTCLFKNTLTVGTTISIKLICGLHYATQHTGSFTRHLLHCTSFAFAKLNVARCNYYTVHPSSPFLNFTFSLDFTHRTYKVTFINIGINYR